MMSKRSLTAASVSVVALAAATWGAGAAAEAPDSASEPQTFNVVIDGHVDDFKGSFFGYYPNQISVHPGDTIVFTSEFTGEPHSIAFGTDIQTVLEYFVNDATPEVQSGQAPPPPEIEAAFAAIPPMLPDGEGDATQSSVNPCFVEAGGEIPTDPAAMCEVTTASPFTGTEKFYNSGFLPDTATFEMQLSEDLAPGTYFGLCTLHFTEMIFRIDVVAPGDAIPSPDEVATAGLEQLEADAAEAVPAIEEANAMTAEMPAHILAGTGAPDSNVLVIQFLPEDVTVAAGDPVTWSINGPHTVSFNAPESARTILAQGDDGGFHINPEPLTPAGFEMPAAAEETASPEGSMDHSATEPAGTEAAATDSAPAEEEAPPPVDAGTWNGEGFLNSGLMFGGDFTLTFDTPGTYEYHCLIHPEMQGTITVT